MSLNTTPRTWVAGETVTAAEMNAEVHDAITGMQAVWTAYTPTWTGTTTNPTLGNGTITGRSGRVGKTLVAYEVIATLGSTTTVGSGGYAFSLPFSAQSGQHIAAGSGNFFDTSATTEFGRFVVKTAVTAVALFDAAGARVGAAIPVVPATGDIISANGTCELA